MRYRKAFAASRKPHTYWGKPVAAPYQPLAVTCKRPVNAYISAQSLVATRRVAFANGFPTRTCALQAAASALRGIANASPSPTCPSPLATSPSQADCSGLQPPVFRLHRSAIGLQTDASDLSSARSPLFRRASASLRRECVHLFAEGDAAKTLVASMVLARAIVNAAFGLRTIVRFADASAAPNRL